MPIPKPKENEEEQEFIGRCIPLVITAEELDGEDEDDRKQAVAICYTQWRRAKGEAEPEEGEGRALNLAVKFLGETEDAYRVGGYGLVWGSQEQRDLSPWPNQDGSKGEFFTPQTQGLDDLPAKALTFEHDKELGPDGHPFTDVLGKSVLERNDVIGRWVEALVEKRRKYAQYVIGMVNRGLFNFSSETAAHWREVAENGEIKRWRTAGYSLTTHPMEPRLTGVSNLAKSFKSVGLELAEPQTGGDSGGPLCLEAAQARARAELLLTEIERENTGGSNYG